MTSGNGVIGNVMMMTASMMKASIDDEGAFPLKVMLVLSTTLRDDDA